jgi:hypothetical protein
MPLEIEKTSDASGRYRYAATCREADYQFEVTGQGATATEADADLRKNITEMAQRLDELMQMSKVSA